MRDREETVAEVVETILDRDFDTRPGRRERHDAQGGKLRVDFVYPEADPVALALEITGIHDPADRAGTKAAFKMEKSLSELAESEGWGLWIVAVESSADMALIKPTVTNLIRADVSVRPGWYSVDDLTSRGGEEAKKFVAWHTSLKEMGLVELHPVEGSGNEVRVLSMSGDREIGGFANWLDDAIKGNAEKLGEARPMETHLAIEIYRFDASRFASETPPPELPEEIDRLWVLHIWGPQGLPGVWTADRGGTEWSFH